MGHDDDQKPLSWGDLLARQIMLEQTAHRDDAHFLKTKDPYIIGPELKSIVSQMNITDVFSRALQAPEHAITGLSQFGYRSERRPSFYIEAPDVLETILHADFEKTQFAITIREHPVQEDFFQIDEADIILKDPLRSGPPVTVDIKLDCSRNETRTALLNLFLDAFSKAVAGIADKGHRGTYAEHQALLAARAIQASNNHLYRSEKP